MLYFVFCHATYKKGGFSFFSCFFFGLSLFAYIYILYCVFFCVCNMYISASEADISALYTNTYLFFFPFSYIFIYIHTRIHTHTHAHTNLRHPYQTHINDAHNLLLTVNYYFTTVLILLMSLPCAAYPRLLRRPRAGRMAACFFEV